MPGVFVQVMISAEDRRQAGVILDSLLEKRLVTGGMFLEGPARFLWKGAVQNMHYCMILTWTLAENRDAIDEDVTRTSEEEVPMISYVEMDGNEAFLAWIDETLSYDGPPETTDAPSEEPGGQSVTVTVDDDKADGSQ